MRQARRSIIYSPMRTGVATMTLDYGQCPPWLFQRMTRLGRVIATAIISEFGSAEFIRRLADPVWFQSSERSWRLIGMIRD